MTWNEDQYREAVGRAAILRECGRVEEAQSVLQDALDGARASGDEAAALYFESRLARLHNDYERGAALARQAAELKPGSALIVSGMGSALDDLGRQEEAIEWCDKALAIDPDCLFALYNRGVALANLDRYQEAIEWFDKVLAITPDDASAQRSRAIILGLAGETAEARQALQRYLEQHPDDETARTWFFRFSDAPQAQEEARQLEEQRERREREAREQKIKLDAWRSLSARSAHRIGNQLFASRGALRTLKETATGEGAEAVADMQGCLDRMSSIVQEFQAFSTNRPPNLKPSEIGPLLEEVVRRYRGLAEGVEIRLETPDEAPVCLLDRQQMDQAIGELLENAIHHVSPKGTVHVWAGPAETAGKACVRVTIEDSGPGVAAKDKGRIFEPFVTTRAGGSGLGLAIVRQIVENHEGTIRETGKAGTGARFEIDLPAALNDRVDP